MTLEHFAIAVNTNATNSQKAGEPLPTLLLRNTDDRNPEFPGSQRADSSGAFGACRQEKGRQQMETKQGAAMLGIAFTMVWISML